MYKYKVSIVIPAYNTVNVIDKTINSVENQTYKNYELVIVNDGSTDGTKELLDNYKKSKNNVIVYHQSNQGVSAARNKGIELANGEFICFLDSDDTYDSKFLEIMVFNLSNEIFDAACCQTIQKNKDNSEKKHIIKQVNFIKPNDYLDLTKEATLLQISCFMIRKQFLIDNHIRFDVEQFICEDVLFRINLLKAKIKVIHMFLFTYHYRDDSTTNTFNEKKILNDILGWYKIKNLIITTDSCIENKKEYIEFTNKLILIKILQVTKRYLKSFNYKEIMNLKKSIYFDSIKQDIHINKLKKREKRLLKYLNNNSYLIWMIASIYYRFIKR